MTYQVEEELNGSVVRESINLIEHLARPVFKQHLLFSNEDDLVAQCFALAHKVAAFEKGGEANDAERF
jgi:hypothetical protein